MLTFEAMPTTHEDHKPKQEGDFLVLCAVEGPSFVKRGTSKTLRTGVKLQVPAGSLCSVAYRRKHGNGFVLSDMLVYTASPKTGDDGKPVEGTEGEGLTGEISVQVTAPSNIDLNIRLGEPFAVAYLSQFSRKPKVETQPKSDPQTSDEKSAADGKKSKAKE